MKKFFSILLTAALALVSVPSCGGGGDSYRGRMTAQQFKNGSHYFRLAAKSGTLEIHPDPDLQVPGSYEDKGVISKDDTTGTYVEEVAGQGGLARVGDGGTAGALNNRVDLKYSVICNGAGTPLEATLYLTLRNEPNGDDPITDFLDIDVPNRDDDNDQEIDEDGEGREPTSEVVISLFYETGTWSIAGGDNDDDTGILYVSY